MAHLRYFGWNSIRFKLISSIFIILLPLIIFLFYDNLYAINVIHDQVAESYKSMMTQSMLQIDTNFEVVDNYLSTMAATDTNLQLLNMNPSDNTRTLATSATSTKLGNDILAYNSMDGLLVFDTVHNAFIYATNSSEDSFECLRIKDYIIHMIHTDPKVSTYTYPKGWLVRTINSQSYFIRLFKSDNLYVGAWVNANRLIQPLRSLNLGHSGTAMLTQTNGRYIVSTSPSIHENIKLTSDINKHYMTQNGHLIVTAPSNKGDFYLVALIQDRKILEKLPMLQQIINIIVILSIILLPLSFLLMRKVILTPLNRILTVMKKVRDGNTAIRINPHKTSDEFILVNDTFNSMLNQICDLKISVYEEQLSKQKAELHYLQLQVNPHFFLNSLNIIYRLAQKQDYRLIQEMSFCLLEYFRYMFRGNSAFVPLKDELEHVRNYIRIQELRFPGNLASDIVADGYLLDRPIPPLVIQNFVENSVKYAVTLDEPVKLSICVNLVENDNSEAMHIIIRDSGDGFPDKVLNDIRMGKRITSDTGEHVGIWNVQRRLALLYSGKAKIAFSNGDPTGAVVEMTLPLFSQDEAYRKNRAESGE